jgi:DNA polymerase III gamma/tau subunit
MPKKVRRLLAQMLSVKPAARPQDPLAFYRQIQDCIAQVDRRESMARRFGVPFLSRSNVVELPRRRPFPTKAVALAAALLAIATVTAVMLPQYLRHQRIRQAEEPIGVPIGVPDGTASAPPVTAQAPAVAPAPVRPQATTQTTVAQQNPAPSVAPESTPLVASAPVQPESPRPAPANKIEEQPKVAANETKNQQPITETPQPSESVHAETSEPELNRDTKIAAIPTARPVSPEVRRAEPVSPAEGPEEVAPATEKKVVPSTKAKKERAAKPKREPDEEEIPRDRVANEDEETDAALPQLPRGRTRARFIGVTADGNWMFSLPSKKIVIVPPPPGG